MTAARPGARHAGTAGERADLGQVVAIGECMLELSAGDADRWRLGHGGDTFNTALYLARLGANMSFMTALGADPFSDTLRARWSEEGLGTSLILTDPDRLPGMYAIRTDEAGERSFYYWRDRSAARRLFDLPGCGPASEAAGRSDLLYVTGITLSLFDAKGRRAIADIARSVRGQGGHVAFDPNYRPRGWPSSRAAREAIAAFAPHVSIALPTFDDEQHLYGDPDPHATAARWRATGATEIVVKLGERGCAVVTDGGPLVVPTTPVKPLDTTGAGDAFNAGYLAARRFGHALPSAARFGNLLAGEVVRHPGAIMPRAAMPILRPPG